MPKGIPKNGVNKGWFRNETAGYWSGKKRSKETIEKMRTSLTGRIPWNKGKEYLAIRGENNHFFGKHLTPWNKGKPHMQDEHHPQWKADKVGYYGLHTWIQRKLGKPDTCENCKVSGFVRHKIHWANKSHEYKRDIADWIRLCVKCHSLFDHNILSVCP